MKDNYQVEVKKTLAKYNQRLNEFHFSVVGLNGRPEKLPDVCYSWWVVASLRIIGRLNWLDDKRLKNFILACQDTETGGFSDRPDDMPDPFHTLFGLAGLSLMNETLLKPINPVFCMPQQVIDRLQIKPQIL